MNITRERIYIQQWLDLKPYEKQVPSDIFYLKLSNDVKQAIVTNELLFKLAMYLDKKQIDILSCFLTSYLEDLISETNIWNTFVKQHTFLYHKPLPFYNVDEYYEEEINVQDICFLIWYFVNTFQPNKLIAPSNNFIVEMANNIYDVFDKAWDDAPENTTLKTYYTFGENETDFYKARKFIATILFETYLFYPDTACKLYDDEMNIISKNKDKEHLKSILNENHDSTIHKAHTRLLSLTGKEWASKLIGENHPLYEHFPNMSKKIQGYFLYKGQNDVDIFIEHIASGKKFNLTKKSFDRAKTLKEIDTILFMGIVLWRDEWWFSGVYFSTDFNADLILDEKNSLESRMAVNIIDHQRKEVNDILEKQFDAFMSFTNGQQIVFLVPDKLNEFIKNFTEHYNASLKLTKKVREEAHQRAKNDGFFETEDKLLNEVYDCESALIFFNPKSGVEIAFHVNSAFPLPNNPFFNSDETDDHIINLLLSEDLSKELVMYCIDNCNEKLPCFNEVIGKIYLNNIDFVLRFSKASNYFSKPSITLAG